MTIYEKMIEEKSEIVEVSLGNKFAIFIQATDMLDCPLMEWSAKDVCGCMVELIYDGEMIDNIGTFNVNTTIDELTSIAYGRLRYDRYETIVGIASDDVPIEDVLEYMAKFIDRERGTE